MAADETVLTWKDPKRETNHPLIYCFYYYHNYDIPVHCRGRSERRRCNNWSLCVVNKPDPAERKKTKQPVELLINNVEFQPKSEPIRQPDSDLKTLLLSLSFFFLLFCPLFSSFFWKRTGSLAPCAVNPATAPLISQSQRLLPLHHLLPLAAEEQKHSPGLGLPPGHALFGPLGVGRQVVDQLAADLVGGLERFVLLHTETKLGINLVCNKKKENAGFWGIKKKRCEFCVYDGRHKKKTELKVYYGRRRACESWIYFLFSFFECGASNMFHIKTLICLPASPALLSPPPPLPHLSPPPLPPSPPSVKGFKWNGLCRPE